MRKMVSAHEVPGMVFCQDVTGIRPSRLKGGQKSCVVEPADARRLLNVSNGRLFVSALTLRLVREDDAAERMVRAAIGPGVTLFPAFRRRNEHGRGFRGMAEGQCGSPEESQSIEEVAYRLRVFSKDIVSFERRPK